MTETPSTPAKRFVGYRWWKIAIGSILVVIIYVALSSLRTHQREQKIFMLIKLSRGQVLVEYAGPNWIPTWFRERCPIFDRIQEVSLVQRNLPAKLVSDLGSLSSLKKLGLYGVAGIDAEIPHLRGLSSLVLLDLSQSQISDYGLEPLKRLKHLEHLFLCDTTVSDAGLRQISGLTSLKTLDLRGTQTTERGREEFRKTSPGCVTTPTP